MRAVTLVASVLFATVAAAQEPVGCDKFKWPLDRERAMLTTAIPVASGAEQPGIAAMKVALLLLADAKLPMEPTREPKQGTYAGFVRIAAPASAGTYRITLAGGGWIDVVQGGSEVKAAAFSGVSGCDGLRKSVKFVLEVAPFIVGISGSTAPDIAIVITPD
jgi:hypothetical protein